MLKGQYFLDLALPFRSRTSALACVRTTRAVAWLLRRQGFFALCYLDDFVGVESSREKAEEEYACFLTTTTELGLELAAEKCIPPTQSLIWLGFQIDAVNMVVNLP